MKRYISRGTAMLLTLLALVSCSDESRMGEDTVSAEETKRPAAAVEIRLEGDTVSCAHPSVYVEEERVSITSHGTYIVSGTWNDGQIWVECIDAGEVNLILQNAEITNDNQACIVFQKAQTATLTLADGTVNKLTDGLLYHYEDPTADEPDGALYSKEDLTITGGGTLTIAGNYKNGITSKDGLKIESGTIDITSADHGIKGKDWLIINGGTVTVSAAGDGIKSTNEESELVGYIEINGGTVDIRADDEAVSAVSAITVNGGTVTVDSTNNGVRCTGDLAVNGGAVHIDAKDNAIEVRDVILSEDAELTVLGFPYRGK